MLDLLDAANAKATFFCIAQRAREQRTLCREIVQRGHSVQNHSDRHGLSFAMSGLAGFARELSRAQATLTEITGQAPTFFRAPAGLRNPLLGPALERNRLRLVSWTRRGFDTVQRRPQRIALRLGNGLAAGDILVLHDGNSARGANGDPGRARRTAAAARAPGAAGPAQRDTGARVSRRVCGMTASPGHGLQVSARSEWQYFVDAASEPYRSAGHFAWHFARGKLRLDPVFPYLLREGLIAPGSHVLDIGCGQGLLASLLGSAALLAREGRWPAQWRDAPLGVRLTGIELMPRDVQRARAALETPGSGAKFVCGDMRHTAFPGGVDAVVILDVLHYISVAEQDAVLARVREALRGGGRLLLRVGDASARRGFRASQWVDAVVTFVRGHRVTPVFGRPLAAWIERLESLGFEVRSEPMSQGTPFANVLLVATLAPPTPTPMLPLTPSLHAAATP